MDDKIVYITGSSSDPPLKIIDRDYTECRHVHYEVHPDLPLVYCRDCDAVLDPYWVLRQIATNFQQRHYYVEQSRREAAKMEKLVKRQMEARKSKKLAERDAREIVRLQKTQQADKSDFNGDISIKSSEQNDG